MMLRVDLPSSKPDLPHLALLYFERKHGSLTTMSLLRYGLGGATATLTVIGLCMSTSLPSMHIRDGY